MRKDIIQRYTIALQHFQVGMAKQRKEGSFRERKVPFAKGRFFFYERKISVGPREIFYVSSDTIETI